MAERTAFNCVAEGSSPSSGVVGVETIHAPIAQLVERESYELEAVGSNPTWSTCRPGIGILIATDISFCHSFLAMGKT